MSSTTRPRRPISIYDYPEHLNPFSESHLNMNHMNVTPDKRRIIVDKFGKNGTWSSKITKRLNRSVSWIEKSWLQVDNSPRRAYESRICNDLHNNALYTRQSQVHNVPVTRRESCSDVRRETDNGFPECLTNGNSIEKSKSVENLNKCDTKRRKKRPAPLPPSAPQSPTATEMPIVEYPDKEMVANGECKREKTPETDTSVCHENETSMENQEDETKSIHEVPIENNPHIPTEEVSTPIDESKLSEQIENIKIDENDTDEEQSKPATCVEPAIDRGEPEQDVIEGQLDENANISSANDKIESSEVAKSNQKISSLTADIEIRV